MPLQGSWSYVAGSKLINQQTTATFPGGRYGQSLWYSSPGKAYLYGGYGYGATTANYGMVYLRYFYLISFF